MLRTIDHDRVVELRLDRPPANALDPELIAALREAIRVSVDGGAGALVLSGSPGLFTGGLDVPSLLRLDREGMHSAWGEFFGVMGDLAGCPVPVAAAITGHSPAGGAVLSLFCDWRVMAEGDFRIGLNEVQVGIPMPPPIHRAAQLVVGPRQAERMCVTGALLDVGEAFRIGLVDEVVPLERVVQRAIEWCGSVLALPGGPLAKTRRLTRQPLIESLQAMDRQRMDEIVDDWFGEETQAALRALVARLADKRKA